MCFVFSDSLQAGGQIYLHVSGAEEMIGEHMTNAPIWVVEQRPTKWFAGIVCVAD